MSDKFVNRHEPVLIKDEGVVKTYKYPDAGEEFSALVEYPINIEEYTKKDRVNLIVVWGEDVPLIKQLAQLKSICPALNSKSRLDLLKEIKNTSEWNMGEFWLNEAEKIVKAAKEAGLQLLMR
jgi:hypothetical protein